METNTIHSGDNNIEISAHEKDMIIVERFFCKHTKLDSEIKSLSIHNNPRWLYIIVRIIRFYQNNIAVKLGNRCVFDPSCSHYAELAFRKKGFFKGIQLTVKRLYRCRSSNGGKDLIK